MECIVVRTLLRLARPSIWNVELRKGYETPYRLYEGKKILKGRYILWLTVTK